MARRRLQSRATEKEPLSENGSLTGSLDSVLSLQQYLDDEMFSELDIPKAGPPLEVAKRNITRSACSKALHTLVWAFALVATITSIWGMTSDIIRLVCLFDYHITLPLNISALSQATGTGERKYPSSQLAHDLSMVSGRLEEMERTVAQTLPDPLRRNFALLAGGAAIISEYTSPTFPLPRRSWKTTLLARIRAIDVVNANIKLPTVVLGSTLSLGECWEFKGNTGHIGIHLTVPVKISDIIVDHINPILCHTPNKFG